MAAQKDNRAHTDYHRNGTRFDVEHDLVIHHKGVKYPCKMKNISITGVIASVPGLATDDIQVGDTCGVSFCTDPDMNPGVYSSRVTRIDPAGIALNFLSFIL
jgi:hypothetical protein